MSDENGVGRGSKREEKNKMRKKVRKGDDARIDCVCVLMGVVVGCKIDGGKSDSLCASASLRIRKENARAAPEYRVERPLSSVRSVALLFCALSLSLPPLSYFKSAPTNRENLLGLCSDAMEVNQLDSQIILAKMHEPFVCAPFDSHFTSLG